MDDEKVLQEKLRESACNGDLEELRKLIRVQRVDVNSQNSVNGWTALHWAAKRNHKSVVTYLLSEGANPNLVNNTGQKPAQISTEKNIQLLLGGDENLEVYESDLPIKPNYLVNPPFPYIKNGGPSVRSMERAHPQQQGVGRTQSMSELVLKARLAISDERDFIEVELQKDNLTFEALLSLLCSELGVDRKLVYKIRKLPDTIVRKDKDVQRLVDFQEVEVVLSNKATSASSRNYGIVGGSAPKQEQILY